MWRKYWPMALAACAGAVIGVWGVNASYAMAAFQPMIWIAEGLRALSLTNDTGNACAWALYALLSLAPLSALLPRKRKRGWADALALLWAAYGFWYWYAMVNAQTLLPDLWMALPGAENVFRAMLTIIPYTLAFGIAAFRLTEPDDGANKTLARLRATIYIILMYLCASAALTPVLTIREAMANSGADAVYACTRCACAIAVTAMLAATLVRAQALLGGMRVGWFAEENALLAAALNRCAKALLITTVLCELIRNGAALLMLGRAVSVSAVFNPPIIEFALACACAMFARFVSDGVKLRRENDSFI